VNSADTPDTDHTAALHKQLDSYGTSDAPWHDISPYCGFAKQPMVSASSIPDAVLPPGDDHLSTSVRSWRWPRTQRPSSDPADAIRVMLADNGTLGQRVPSTLGQVSRQGCHLPESHAYRIYEYVMAELWSCPISRHYKHSKDLTAIAISLALQARLLHAIKPL